ncbi:conserved hypothetical protein [Mesorhizobium sp. ORS 3359]|nr:conserved hypothetical protein [Mesorhizobium sp. ORS 3359]
MNRHPIALNGAHLNADARLFGTRDDLMASFRSFGPKVIGEIGVALGDFSEFMVRTFDAETFVAFDTFEMHKWPSHWGRSSEEIFGRHTHRQHFENRIRPLCTDLRVEVGLSGNTVPIYPDEYFDLLYVDGSHLYEDVIADARSASRVVKKDGTIIFNDYVLFDPFLKAEYGVVQAVNELVTTTDWRIVGFGLQQHMFCDIALRRKAAN